MIELPEAFVLASQIEQTLTGTTISAVTANQSPHKFAWFQGDPAKYDGLLAGKTVKSAVAHGGLVEVLIDDIRLLFGDGVSLRLSGPEAKRPAKHQLLVEFTDGTALAASVQMYGSLWAFRAGKFPNPYYLAACTKPSPLTEQFDEPHFASLLDDNSRKKSAKAFLATEQRIPGLGNGVLQDILWSARVNPRRAMDSLSDEEIGGLFVAVKSTLKQMTEQGGRDTEKDLFGQSGGYLTHLSKNTYHYPCPVCGTIIKKEAYMGGSIYYCGTCQR